MKKNLRVILLLSLGLLFSCQDQLIKDPGDSKQKKFTTSDAKSYFVQNAEYLRPLTFNQESKESRSSLLRDLNLRMDWDKAFYSKLGDAELIEVPIKSNSILYAKEKSTLGVNKQDRITISSRKLIISREEEENYKMFIVTLIPDHKAVVNKSYTAEHFKYLGGSNYSGLVFCSELDGTFGDVFHYENGMMSQRMSLLRNSHSCDHHDCSENHSPQKEVGLNDIVINFKEVIEGQMVSRSFFDSDIDGNGCNFCSDGSCMSCRDNELGEVVVTPDPCYWCYSYPCVCYSVCDWCWSNPCVCNNLCYYCYSYPCRCSFCNYCGSRYCYGSCQNTGGGGTPNPDPGPNPKPDPKPDPDPEPVIDVTDLENYPYINCIYQTLFDNPIFSFYVDVFKAENSIVHLEYKISSDLPANVGGRLENGLSNFWMTINLNENNVNKANLVVARNIIHETFHAYIFSKLFSLKESQPSGTMNSQELLELTQALNNQNYPTLYHYYDKYIYSSTSQHMYMAEYMVETMTNILYDISGMSYSVCEAIAWVGLKTTYNPTTGENIETEAWKRKSQTEKDLFNSTYQDYLRNNPSKDCFD